MTQLMFVPLLVVVLMALANASNLLENGLIFEDIRIENVNGVVAKKASPLRSRRSPDLLAADSPTFAPTASPTEEQTIVPTVMPTFAPTFEPTAQPTFEPTATPTASPSASPSATPTAIPTFAPTATPTFAPTYAPTATPTFTPTQVPTFAAQPPTGGSTPQSAVILGAMVAQGTTADVFNADPNNGFVFCRTVDTASNIPIGSTQDCIASSPTTSPTSRRLQSSSDSAIVSFKIVLASTQAAGFSSAEDAYQSITVALATASATNQLTTIMQQIAASNNISFLLNITIGDAGTTTYEAVNLHSHNRYVSDGEIAGIVIGSIVGVALLGTILYYTLRMRRSSMEHTNEQSNDDNLKVYRDVNEPAAITNGEELGGAHETSLVVAGGNDTRV